MISFLVFLIIAALALWTSIKKDQRIILFDIREKMGKKWNMTTETGYWVPLDGIKTNEIEFFDFKNFNLHLGVQKLKEVISHIENSTIYELNESIDDTEIPITKIDIRDDMSEQYYTSKTFDWVIYKSHESTITFAGDVLLTQLKQEWPEWEKFSGKL